MGYTVLGSSSTTNRGLVPVTDGSSAATGEIGEILTATQATLTTSGVAATGTWGAVTSLAVTAGVWEITGAGAFSENSAVLTKSLSLGISTSATGSGIGTFAYTSTPAQTTGEDTYAVTPPLLVSIAATTTYYLNSRLYYTSGTPKHAGKITARRVG